MLRFPVQPQHGRFHALSGPIPELPLVHVRLCTNEPCIDALISATAYTGSLVSGNAKVPGMKIAPPLPLVATLLSIAKTRARVMKRDPDGDADLLSGCTHRLELSCWDDEGVQLSLVVGLRQIDAGPIVEAALSGLLRATGALEAVVKAIEMERTVAGVVVDNKMTAAQVLEAATRPTIIKGKDIAQHPAYRRYVARDVAQIGSRAYFCAGEAVRLGDQMRRVVDERKAKDRKMRAAKRERRKMMERASLEGNVRKVVKKKQMDFFADEEIVDEQSAKQEHTSIMDKGVKNESVPSEQKLEDDKLILDPNVMKTQTSRNMNIEGSQSAAGRSGKEESLDTAPSQSQKDETRKATRKKKKKRRII